MKHTFTVLIYLFFVVSGLSAQNIDRLFPQKHKIRRVSPEAGLEHFGQRDVQQDPWGFLWTITQHNLFRFDGYTYKRYTDRLPLLSSTQQWQFYKIHLSADHRLYVASAQGLWKYNPLADNFDRCFDREIFFIHQDSLGRTWVKTHTIGLLDMDTYQFTEVFDFHGVAIEDVGAISSNHRGVFIATKGGVTYRYDESAGCFEQLRPPVHPGVVDIRIKESHLYVLTDNDGLFILDVDQQKLINHYSFFYPEGDRRASTRKMYLTENKVWIASLRGLFEFDPKTGHTIQYQFEKRDPYGLPSSSTWHINEDRQGDLWIGSYSGGLSMMSNNEWVAFQSFSPMNSDLSYPIVSAFAEQDDYIWIATEGGGLNRFNTVTQEFTTYRHQRGKNSLTFDNIPSLLLLKNRLLVGTSRGGLDILDTRTGRFTNLTARSDSSSLLNDHVIQMEAEGDSAVWIRYMINDSCVSRFSLHDQTFRHYSVAKAGRITGQIRKGHGDTLWVATSHLSVLNAETGQIDQFPLEKEKTLKIQSTAVDPHTGLVYVGTTGEGVYTFDPLTKQYSLAIDLSKFEVYSIYSIQFDDLSNVWLGTNRGLFRYTPATSLILQFNKADGTQGDVYYANATTKTSQGVLFFGGNEGFTAVLPSRITPNLIRPQVIVTDFQLDYVSVNPSTLHSPLTAPIHTTRSITLNHTQNSFGFEFSSTNLINPMKNRFRYRLRGYDDQWRESGAEHRLAYFSQVTTGKYTLEVQTANNDGVWGEIRPIEIELLPPWWLTPWAKSVFVALFFLLVYLLWRYYEERRMLNLKLYYEERERQREEEVHQAQLRFFTNVAHDFRTPITLIMGALDYVKRMEIPSKHLVTFENNAKRLLGLVNELLDFRALQNGKIVLKPEAGSWNQFVETICSDFFLYARQFNIRFTTHFDRSIVSGLKFDPKVMEKIVMNLINNAFKYTSAGGEITVQTFWVGEGFESSYVHQIKVGGKLPPVTQDHQHVQLVISDSGVGISEQSIEKVFDRYFRVNDAEGDLHLGSGIGLALVKNLVELHRGSLTLYSERSKGTDVVVEFVLPQCPVPDGTSEYRYEPLPVPAQVPPLPEEEPQAKPTGSLPISAPDRQLKRILLVEDNAEIREMLTEMLSTNFSITGATDGDEALQWLNSDAAYPDLVITDLVMERVDGIALCRAIKSNPDMRHIPIVMLTARTGDEDHIRGLESGADLYLEKPVRRKLLLTSIDSLMQQRERLKEYLAANPFMDLEAKNAGRAERELMNKLMEVIDRELSNPNLGVNELAASLAMSRGSLYNKVKAMTGKSIVEFIRSYRLYKASVWMIERNLSTPQLLEEIGIVSQSHFSRAFKKEFGITPSEFTAKYRKS